MKISAVIFCRKGSKRLKNKNFATINKKTLIENKILQLFKTNIDEIIVGSDDDRIKKIVSKFKGKNKKIFFIKRKKKYCIESCSINDAIKNMLSLFDTDFVLWAHLTNPLTNQKHYNAAINIFKKNLKKYDGLYSVNINNNYFWGLDQKPINHNPQEKSHTILSTGKIKPLYSDNGAIFIRKHKDMKRDGKFWSKRPVMFKMSEKDGWDINSPWDLEACKLKSFKKKIF